MPPPPAIVSFQAAIGFYSPCNLSLVPSLFVTQWGSFPASLLVLSPHSPPLNVICSAAQVCSIIALFLQCAGREGAKERQKKRERREWDKRTKQMSRAGNWICQFFLTFIIFSTNCQSFHLAPFPLPIALLFHSLSVFLKPLLHCLCCVLPDSIKVTKAEWG